MGRRTDQRMIRRIDTATGTDRTRPDVLVVEEPLEIRVRGRSLAVTMRTPGDDHDLAHGFLLTEGVIRDRRDVTTLRYCAGKDEDGRQTYNVLDAALAPHVADPEPGLTRRFTTTSACGVCGKDRIEDVVTRTAFPPGESTATFDPALLADLPARLRAEQPTFDTTGGLHAAGLFTAEGALLFGREDVGRHNAVDKVLGAALMAGRVPAGDAVLAVSGRASFELVQKAQMAGVPALVAVSAPSTLAVDLAASADMLLAGFTRDGAFNLYTGAHRLRSAG